MRARVNFLQCAAKYRVIGGIFNAVVNLVSVMIHNHATPFADQWFFVTHNEILSRP